ncbi:ribonuclease pancreatic-like [Phascolarctos cinereus]|uniref:Ribonuclease pancreatic-like n=1 Tax=Phascolarctos cinereus TaxID=38626 RepID=A0A6P5K049_PHACI|nr:ribonuclease pancreatic-like [Phascolarctos cinereus]
MTLEKIHLPLSLLLLLLSSLLQPGSCQVIIFGNETGVQRFWRLHVDYPKSNIPGGESQYCTVMIHSRQILDNGKCIQENTFIHAVAGDIFDVCKTPRMRHCYDVTKNCHLSDISFTQTLCVLQECSRFPKCTYVGFPKFNKIWLACEGIPPAPVYLDP